MKRLISFLLSIIMLLSFSISVFALSPTIQESSTTTIEVFEDGSYLTTTIVQTSINSPLSRSTITGSKSATFTDVDNVVRWRVYLHGTYTYNGTSSTCTDSSVSYSILDSAWKVTSAIASRSANKAIGDFTIKQYILGIPVRTHESHLTLTCSPNGVLS